MNVLIAGGAGFLGANLVRRCLDEGADVTVLDSLEPRLKATLDGLRAVLDRISFVQGDMADSPLVQELVSGQDVIFNCAAQTSHPLSMQDPVFDAGVNCVATLTFLEAIRKANPRARVVFTSSSTVVGRTDGEEVDEGHVERPLDVYSANKGVAEKYHLIYHHAHGLRTVVLRFSNLYGPYGKGYPEFSFINYFIHLAWTGRPITVYGSGEQTRNALFADDATDLLWLAAMDERLVGDVFFAAHDEQHTVLRIAETVVRVLGRGEVTRVPWPPDRKRIDVDNVRIRASKLRRATGWGARYSLEDGLRLTRAKLEEMTLP